jgi:mannose-6-phosphate isomerase-like protein (cupin superfamily)
MFSKRKIAMCGIVVFLSIFLVTLVSANAADTTEQVVNTIDQILKDNPLKPGEKSQMITIAQDDAITLYVMRFTKGLWIKPHFHKTHDETIYFIKGTAQMLINDKWVDMKPGTLHFNPMGKVHSLKSTSDEPTVIISVFTPAMKVVDRQYLEEK